MKKTLQWAIMLLMIAVLWSCSTSNNFKPNQMYNGFRLVEKRFVEEVNAECLYFIHEKSGARLIKIAADDPNKMFNITFKTLPETDYGTPHILEHAVLNGSRNFPVKSPFDVLLKGSLNTFLNAMTSSDWTAYPVSSMNDKDYFNLMHVYLDAVFNPRIYDDPRILQQEGWHYELEDPDGELVIKGVVYNEMKGSFSSPLTELSYQVNKILFPDNTYGVSSGGYPQAIPGLTQEYFADFHRTFYHPSNSYIMLYGDADLIKELEFIDREYLSHYEKSEAIIDVKLQKPFDAMKVAEKPYAVPEGSSTKDNTYLSMSFVAGESIDRELVMAFQVLASALVNHESAPVRKALQEAGIGKDVRASFRSARQNVFQILVQNANPEDKDRFREIVLSTLNDVIENGLDKTMLEGIINRTEFNLREDNTPNKGYSYVFAMTQGWLFADNPFLGLQYEAPLASVKDALTSSLLEDLAQKYMIENPHALLMALVPEQGLENKINAQLRKELAEYKKTLTSEEIQEIIRNTRELREYQKTDDSPEAIATIPMLQLSDISPEPNWFEAKEKKEEGIPVLYLDEFTNKILYTSFYFDIRVLPQELIPYTEILSTILGRMNTKNYTFGELENSVNIHTGGISASTDLFLENQSDDSLLPKFIMNGKSTSQKSDKLMELMSEIINHTQYNDKNRLKTLLTRHQSRFEASLKNNGRDFATTRLNSYFSQQGMYNELTQGLEYYYFITALVKNFDAEAENIIAKLEQTASLLFNQKNMVASVTGTKDEYKAFTSYFARVLSPMSKNDLSYSQWNFVQQKQNEGLITASKVQYVIQGYDFKKLGYSWNGKMRVLNQILSREYLQTQVRVVGGAYGGYARISSNGMIHFGSFRDPNLAETLQAYQASSDFLESFDADESLMTRYIIGTIAGLDRPTIPSQRGMIASRRWFEKTTYDFLKQERTEILNTTAQDIRNMKQLVSDVLAQNAICVYGGEEKIRQNSRFFSKLVNID
jgi:presequence protease